MYYSDSVEVKDSEFGGKGLFTTKEYRAGEVVLAVPQEYFIDYDYLLGVYPHVGGKTSNKRV